MRPAIDGAVVLVTGASSGIGRELARQLATRVKALVLVARRRDRLVQLAAEIGKQSPGLVIDVKVCDLNDRTELSNLCDQVLGQHGCVDILINNAGMGDIGMFDLASWEKTEAMLELNVRALTYLTHRLVGPMVQAGSGGVLMISSGFGLSFMPGFSAYVGSKHFVTSFSESLRLDLSGTGVAVTQVCPGPVATEFEEVAGNFSGRKAPAWVEISAARCAKAALRGFERGRAMVVPGFVMRAMLFFGALTPRFLFRLIYAPAARWLRRKQLRVGHRAGGVESKSA